MKTLLLTVLLSGCATTRPTPETKPSCPQQGKTCPEEQKLAPAGTMPNYSERTEYSKESP